MSELGNKNAYEEQLYGKVTELIALAHKQVTTSVKIDSHNCQFVSIVKQGFLMQ